MKCSTKITLIAAAVTASISQSSIAQTAEEEASKPSSLDFEQIIVTGTSRPKEKIESTNAMTTFGEEKLERLAPYSVGELVRSIPGFHAEDTGGETGNNVAPRGFPLSTQTEFTALLRDGMTVFYNQDVLFTQNDRFTRLSNFIGNVEAIRGGASSIFVGSAPAGFINFLSREGGDDTEGDVFFETNSNNRLGAQAWVSGSINEQTVYAIGGWYRKGDSARDPGYTANQGGELNANVKYFFEDASGFTRFEFNKQNDKSFFFIPQPLTGSTTDAQTIPGGMDIRDGTTGNSAGARLLRLANTPSGDIDLDVTDGNFADVTYFGNTTEVELNDAWTFSNQVRYTDMLTTFTGIINVGNAESLSGKAQAIFDTNEQALADAVFGGELNYRVVDAGTGFELANNSNVDSFNTNGFGINAGFWHRRFEGDNLQNETKMRHIYEGFDEGTFYSTFGLFVSNINGHVTDYRINTLQSVEPLPQRLDIAFIDAEGNDIASGTYKGIQAGSHGFANIVYNESTIAPYADFEYEIDDLTLNLGARYETLRANGEAENPGNYEISSFTTDSDPVNGNIILPFGAGTYRNFDVEYNELAWTVAANYIVNEDFAVFTRYADGFRMPDVDKYMAITDLSSQEEIDEFNRSERRETQPASTVMAELGFKYNSGDVAAFLTGYYAAADDLFFNVPTVVNNQVVQRQAFRNTETLGLEAEFNLQVTEGWSVGLSATYQDPEFVNTPAAEFINSDGNVDTVDINGNMPVRVPKHFGQLTSSYEFEDFAWGVASINATYSWSGKRYADDANTAELPFYGMLNLGFAIENEDGYYLRADVKNVNNSEGLSEGDPRAGETVAGQSTTFNARVVLPRTFTVSVGKRF
jgi:outer membrane receptor protein involved in Fe transport